MQQRIGQADSRSRAQTVPQPGTRAAVGNAAIQRLVAGEPIPDAALDPGLRDAAAVVRQRRAGGPTTRRATTVQRFGESEHKFIGDRATKGATIALAPGVVVTHGDLVGLGGDYFGSFDELNDLVLKPGIKKGTRGEVMYALHVRIRDEPESLNMGKLFDDSAKTAVMSRYYELASDNPEHFTNPLKGDAKLSTRTKATRRDRTTWDQALGLPGTPIGGGGNYRENHERAVELAARLGRAKQPIDPAMAVEAFGEHYLTDMFSAGHVRTERTSIAEYWDPKVPMFTFNFPRFLAEEIAKHIDAHGAWYERALSVDQKVTMTWPKEGALAGVQRALAGLPELSFGSVVALAVHDYDIFRGVEATSGGKALRLVGDSGLFERDAAGNVVRQGGIQKVSAKGGKTMDAAVAAVRASVKEVRRAYAAGRRGTDPAATVKQALTKGGGIFAAEDLIPKAVPDAKLPEADKSLKWDFTSVDDLLASGPMQKALAKFMENKASEFDSVLAGAPANAKAAIAERIQRPMRGGPTQAVPLLRRVVDYTPSTGGGVFGHNQDDNAVDYYLEAKKRGALDRLTLAQKERLIRDVLSGATVGNEETMILDLLEANHADGIKLISAVSFRRLWQDLDGDENKRFINRFGPLFWATQSYQAKLDEIRYHAAGRTSERAEETIIIILRTCTPAQVRSIDNAVDLAWNLTGKEDDEYRRMIKVPAPATP
jgi:hypothetical protein